MQYETSKQLKKLNGEIKVVLDEEVQKTKEQVETQGLMIDENKEELEARIEQLSNEISNVGAKANKSTGSGGPELKAIKELAKDLEDRVDTLEYNYKKHLTQTEENTESLKTMKDVAAKRSARKEKPSRDEAKKTVDTNTKSNNSAPGFSPEQLQDLETEILQKADDNVQDKMDEVFTSISDMEIKLKKLIEVANEKSQGTNQRVDDIQVEVQKLQEEGIKLEEKAKVGSESLVQIDAVKQSVLQVQDKVLKAE